MAYIRTNKNENPFVQVDKTFVEDNNLKWASKGLMVYLLSRPDDWSINQKDLVNRSTDGEAAVRTALLDLMANGYVHYYAQRNPDGTVAEWVYEVFESPEFNKHKEAAMKEAAERLSKKKAKTAERNKKRLGIAASTKEKTPERDNHNLDEKPERDNHNLDEKPERDNHNLDEKVPERDNHDLGNPVLDNHDLGNPVLGKHDLDNPVLDNHSYTNTEFTNIESTNIDITNTNHTNTESTNIPYSFIVGAIDLLSVPSNIKQVLYKYSGRLVSDNINIKDVEEHYHAHKDAVSDALYLDVLDYVLRVTSSPIRSIKATLSTGISNKLAQLHNIKAYSSPIREEATPSWMKDTGHQFPTEENQSFSQHDIDQGEAAKQQLLAMFNNMKKYGENS
ncbi:hypothetical protein ACH2FV_19210 (plasmid) [Bacillus safensis subsp. safensis]|uniref:hypothetical protein n=1 Tax=Bacillus safensis TaxID=561879 RepID=UPI0037C1433C